MAARQLGDATPRALVAESNRRSFSPTAEGKLMKRATVFILVSHLLAVALPAAETVELKLATILPVGTTGHQRLMEMRDTFHKAAGPALKMTVYAGSADGEMLIVKKMRARQIHGALISAVGLAQIDRSVTCLQLILLAFQHWREVGYVRQKIASDLESRLRTKGFEVLFWADAGWVRYFSKAPALHPDELKPMRSEERRVGKEC